MLISRVRRTVVTLLVIGSVAVGASGCVLVPGPGYGYVAPGPPVVVVPGPVYHPRGHYGGYYRGGYRVR